MILPDPLLFSKPLHVWLGSVTFVFLVTQILIGSIVIPSPDTKNIDYDKKLKVDDESRLTIVPITTASSTSTVTVFYYDLPLG